MDDVRPLAGGISAPLTTGFFGAMNDVLPIATVLAYVFREITLWTLKDPDIHME